MCPYVTFGNQILGDYSLAFHNDLENLDLSIASPRGYVLVEIFILNILRPDLPP